jgi:hypothetical protein
MLELDVLIDEKKEKLMSLESQIYRSNLEEQVRQAHMKIESGIMLNEMKEMIKKSKKNWETEAPKIFYSANSTSSISKTNRCERMKVAKLPDAKDFAFFGWCKLAKICSYIDTAKTKTIKDFFDWYGIDPTGFENMSEDEVSVILDSAILKKKFSINKIKVSDETINALAERGIKYEKIDIKNLKGDNAEKKLKLLVDYNFSMKKSNKRNKMKSALGNLENTLLELNDVLMLAYKNPDITHVNVETLDDLAHNNGLLFQVKIKDYK